MNKLHQMPWSVAGAHAIVRSAPTA